MLLRSGFSDTISFVFAVECESVLGHTLEKERNLAGRELLNEWAQGPKEVKDDVVFTVAHAEAGAVHEIVAIEKQVTHLISCVYYNTTRVERTGSLAVGAGSRKCTG